MSLAFSLGIFVIVRGQEGETRPLPEVPQLAEASGEASSAIGTFRKPKDWDCRLIASEPMLGNPVAFTIDGKGRFYICESYRQGVGVTDNRSHDAEWLQADLSAMTVEDRIAYHRRLLGDAQVSAYESKDDLIRLLIDSDGDGVVDDSKVFVSGFNGLEEGTGAGALERDGKVYYTNIPHLWQLEDEDGDGVAEKRESLAKGFGVRVAFRGHDMHGLVNGPDGRIYFSIGDRGYHVMTSQGLLSDPESGAVFRCEPDGSNLEVFATGLRNPQELAFDDYGNLFTGDNNSDSGDRARWVHVVRGGDSGWRMMYQYIPDRGPFNRERIWYPYDEQTPAYIVPPIMNLSDGPSGLVCYPGTGLDDSFSGSFFLVDFRGQASNSGVRRIRMEPQGAGFKVVTNEEFLWNILATDVDFGPDGGIYVSDWVNGWNGENKGRIYRFGPMEIDSQWRVEQTQSLLANGVKDKSDESLSEYLSHPDRRVRQLAQWELASRESVDILAEVAGSDTASTVAMLHGIWGLGQIARNSSDPNLTQRAVARLIPGTDSDDTMIVSRAIEALADGIPSERLSESLVQSRNDAIERGLQSSSPVVQAAACHAAFQLPSERFLPSIVKVIQNNGDSDPILRHAGIVALSAGPAEKIASLSRNASPSVRLAAVVALRRMKHPGVRDFLDDESQMVVREAVRAIHDVPELHGLLPDLAERIVGVPLDDAIVRRVLNANFRLGQPSHARKLAEFAASKSSDEKYRLEALDMLGTWNRPGLNDRVLNRYLPLPDRSVQPAMDALRENMERLAAAAPAIRDRFLEIGANFGLQGVGELIETSFLDTTNASARRASALKALAGISPERAKTLLENALRDGSVEVRVAAIGLIGELNPEVAFKAIEDALQSKQTLERQAAWDALVALPNQDAKAALVSKLWKLFRSGDLPKDVLLNASDAFAAYMPESLQKEYRTYRESKESLRADRPTEFYAECAEGGDVEAGRLLFFTRSSLSCVRCHKIGQTGGEVGPGLSEIGKQKTSEYLLEAIVAPNAKIADGFKTIVVQDEDGSVYSGIVKSENDEELSLLDAQGNLISIPVDSITGRREGLSSMPVDLIKYLSLRELRDLIAYLKSLDGTKEATKGVFETESGGHGLE